MSSTVVKVVEIMGCSKKSWTDAADAAVKTASKTIDGISGIQVEHMTAQVKDGKITNYKTTLKVAFGIK